MSVNNNLWGKLVSSLESSVKFDEKSKVTSVPFFIPDFKLLNSELKILRLKSYIESFYIDIILKQNKFTTLSRFLVKNPK